MKKLTPIEAQRIFAVVDDVLEKLALIEKIMPDVMSHQDELSGAAGDEISRLISDQRTLEAKFEDLIRRRGELKAANNKSELDEVQKELMVVSKHLRDSTKKLCRNLKDNPNIGANLQKVEAERVTVNQLMLDTCRELKDLSFSSLEQQVKQDKDAQEELQETVKKEQETAEMVKELTDMLMKEKEEHTQTVREKNKTMAKYKEDLQELKQRTDIMSEYQQQEANAKSNSQRRIFDSLKASMKQQIDELDYKIAMEQRVHDETMEFLKAKQDELAKQQVLWQEKNDTDVKQKEDELEELKSNQRRDYLRLMELTARMKKDREDKAARQREENRLRELKELQAAEERKTFQAAAKLQAWMRGYLERKKSKGGKKKGKKKKK